MDEILSGATCSRELGFPTQLLFFELIPRKADDKGLDVSSTALHRTNDARNASEQRAVSLTTGFLHLQRHAYKTPATAAMAKHSSGSAALTAPAREGKQAVWVRGAMADDARLTNGHGWAVRYFLPASRRQRGNALYGEDRS
ncbi:hypothetical protein MRX96_026020 [Rhipicephalus microplus]